MMAGVFVQEPALILIGQYDSPFVRRVGIALRLYDLDFEHRPWSTFAGGERVAAYNPLRRVPTLVLDDGEVLIESGAILDHLDEVVGEERTLIPRRGPARRYALKVCALATGVGDKAVSLAYERTFHATPAPALAERYGAQIGAALDALEADRAARPTPWWFGDGLGHADIAVACVFRFLLEVHAELFDAARWPSILAHASGCEAQEVFREISQPFVLPT